MKLTYIFHSGFAVETHSCILVFDYWMDPANCLPEILSKGKPVYVLQVISTKIISPEKYFLGENTFHIPQ